MNWRSETLCRIVIVHNEELRDLYSSPDVVRRLRYAELATMTKETKNACRILDGTVLGNVLEGKQ
jgi:hypothetical protein